MSKESNFDLLIKDVQSCTTCPRMASSKRVLNQGCGPLSAPIMVIGEAPGRLGADSSQLPFHGDKAGHNFEELIRFAGLTRAELFITNAVLCNPRDASGNNSTPLGVEISSCSGFLKRQIDLVNPSFVVTLGAVALKSLASIEAHSLALRDAVRTAVPWYGRLLVPLYHPGQRAMIHRSFANQAADYQFLAETIERAARGRRKKYFSPARTDATVLAEAILAKTGPISYFALHKLSYLSELRHEEQFGSRITGAYYVRQKDGPYCVDLHPARLKKSGLEIIFSGGANPIVSGHNESLFQDVRGADSALSETALAIIRTVVERYGRLSDSKLKTAVYLSGPMREILKKEKSGASQFNAPIFK